MAGSVGPRVAEIDPKRGVVAGARTPSMLAVNTGVRIREPAAGLSKRWSIRSPPSRAVDPAANPELQEGVFQNRLEERVVTPSIGDIDVEIGGDDVVVARQSGGDPIEVEAS